jgi:hypothetical protein
MKFIPTMKRKGRVNSKHEARQRMRLKVILRISAVAVVLLVLGLTIFFQLTSTDKMQAVDQPNATWVIVNEPSYVTETSIPQTIITHEEYGPHTFQYRKVNPSQSGN